MLIRLVNHSPSNKYHVDKMIRVEGIPESILFYKRNGKLFLKAPWTIDVTENIPRDVIAMHQPSPIVFHVHTASPEKGMPAMDEEVTGYALSLDYQSGNCADIWDQIERLIELDTPRGERIPKPVVVAPDIDNDHRNKGWSIRAEDIPVVWLKGLSLSPSAPPPDKSPFENPPVPQTLEEFPCDCGRSFRQKQGLVMHRRKTGHGKPVAVGA